jgi:hypothetical protein
MGMSVVMDMIVTMFMIMVRMFFLCFFLVIVDIHDPLSFFLFFWNSSSNFFAALVDSTC